MDAGNGARHLQKKEIGVKLGQHTPWGLPILQRSTLGFPSISPQIQDDLNNVGRAIIYYVIWDSYTYNPIVKALIKTIRNGINDSVGKATTSTFHNVPTSNQSI